MGRPRTFDEDIAVDRAMDVFWRQGYRGTTPQDLAEAVGVGKGSLYNAFGSKRKLFTRALERYRDEQAVLVDEALEADGPIKERLARALELMIDLNFADPDRRGCLAVNTAAELAGVDEDATERVQAMFARTTRAFTDAIRSGQASGEIGRNLDASVLLSKTTREPEMLKRSVQIALAPL
jgi:TetR/AcrR family transcriptional repressor of nem operon